MKLTKDILTNSKWRVTPEQSKRLQELAFGLGFHWGSSDTNVSNIDSRYLFFWDDMSIGYVTCEEEDYFFNNGFTERKFEDYFEEEPKEANSYDGTFMWAVEQMKQGKKVRRKGHYPETYYRYLEDGTFWNSSTNRIEVHFDLEDFESTDWEIYEEDKSLSSKIQDDDDIPMCKLDIKDVKQFIKDLKKKLDDDLGVECEYDGQVDCIIDELAGDKLL